MSERIQKIVQETDAWCDQNYFGDYHYDLRWEEKFAELIIRECADKVKNFYQEDEFTCYNAAEEIKEHFGIE